MICSPRKRENLTSKIRRTVAGKADFFPCEVISDSVFSLFIKIQWSGIVIDAELIGKHEYHVRACSSATCPGKGLLSKIYKNKSDML